MYGRSVRDRLQLTLIKNYKKKMADEINATGIEVGPPTEFHAAIEEIVEKYELSKIEEESWSGQKRAKELNERNQAMDIRRQELDGVGETKRRKMADYDKPRRQRRQGHHTVVYLKQKSEQDMKTHEDEILLKRDTKKFQETQPKEIMQHFIRPQQQQQTII